MVGVRLRQPLSVNHRRHGGSGSKPSSASTALTVIRNLAFALVAMQGLRMMFMGGSTPPGGQPSNHAGVGSSSNSINEPKGLEDRLRESSHVRRQPPPHQALPKRNSAPLPGPEKDGLEDEETHADSGRDRDHDPESGDDHDLVDSEEEDKTDHGEEPEGGAEEEEPAVPVEDEADRNAGADLKGEPSAGSGLNPIVVNRNGTGPTEVAYVKDFLQERRNSVSGTVDVAVNRDGQSFSSVVAALVQETSVRPCWDVGSDGRATAIHPRCLDPDTPLIAHNPGPFLRTWCGHEIKPLSAVTMTEHCADPTVHLFPQEVPPVSGEHMPPIIIKSSPDKQMLPDDGSLETVECNISCKQEKELVGVERYIEGESWKVTQTMADGTFANEAKIERRDFMVDHFYSTQSFTSDVPMTYFSFDEHSLRNRPAIDFDAAKVKAVYLVSDRCSSHSSNRHKFFDAVASAVSVDSYGSCGHNIDVPEGMTLDTPGGRVAIMKQYRLVLAFDESSSKDHVSTMIWEALASGSLPVVVGAENIREHLPARSCIFGKDFANWDDLSKHVERVIADKELWESYHAWRKDETSLAEMEAKYEFTKASPSCRLCRWAYAKKYGLGWDHEQQQVRSMKLPTDRFCVTANNGLVSRPFSEEWVTRTASTNGKETVLREDSEGESCSSLTTDGDVDIGSYKAHRKIAQHDGVTDIILSGSYRESTDTEVMLRLKFAGIRNPDGAYFGSTHSTVPTTRGSQFSSATIQDDHMKVTVLADWKTAVTCTGEGIMEVRIEKKDVEGLKDEPPRRIRVIIEEMALIHDKMTEYFPSSFNKRMTKDFVDPLGVYYSDS